MAAAWAPDERRTRGVPTLSRERSIARGDRSRLRLTARGVTLLIVGLLLVLAAYWERQVVLLLPAAMCIAVVLGGAWWAIDSVGHVRVGAPGVLQEWAPAVLRIAGTGRHAGVRWSTWAPGEGESLLIEGALDANGQDMIELGAHPRGRWRLVPIDVTAQDPFGVAAMTRSIDPLASLVVGPEVLTVPHASLRSNREDGRVSQVRAADNVDAMVREWRPGDPQRRVHWRQSAKRGQLMVRQEANPAAHDELVVVDTAGAAGFDRDAEDRLARAACSIVRALAHGDRPVEVRETGETSITSVNWRDLLLTLAAFADMDAIEPATPKRIDRPAHVVALAEAPPANWSLPPGTTLWLVTPRDVSAQPPAVGARLRVHRWIDRVGPVQELR